MLYYLLMMWADQTTLARVQCSIVASSAVTGNSISAYLAPCISYDSDSNNCSRFYTSDVKFPKCYSKFTTVVQHS